MIKRIEWIVCLLILYVMPAKSQFFSNQKGATTYYMTYEKKDNTTQIDTSRIINTWDKKHYLIIKQKSNLNNTSLSNEGQTQTFVYDKLTNVTHVIFMDAKEDNERVKKKILSYYPLEKKVEAEKDYQAYQKHMRSKGSISIPLKTDVQKGDNIPECNYSNKIGPIYMTVNLKGTYQGFEVIHTPAGDFHCLKISYTVKTKAMLIISETFHINEWYAEGIGLVKSEERNKRGKIESTRILVTYK